MEPTLNTINGLLSPEGKLYACEYEGHDDLALMIVENYFKNELPESKKYVEQDWLMQTKGFAKLQTYDTNSSSDWSVRTLSGDWDERQLDRLTQKQRDTIFDWSEETGRPMPKPLQPAAAQLQEETVGL